MGFTMDLPVYPVGGSWFTAVSGTDFKTMRCPNADPTQTRLLHTSLVMHESISNISYSKSESKHQPGIKLSCSSYIT